MKEQVGRIVDFLDSGDDRFASNLEASLFRGNYQIGGRLVDGAGTYIG